MSNKTVAVIQARMGSSRFPGKPLKRIGKWSLIELVVKRVNQSSRVGRVVVATSTNPRDDILASHVMQLGFNVHRGSEEDVLSRFYDAVKSLTPEIIVRITGDCPLISPSLIDHAVDTFAQEKVDYLALSIGRDKALAYPRGFDVEVVSFRSLTEAARNATKQYEREHVMPYIYTHQESYSVRYLEPTPEVSRPNYRLCVDTQEDFELILGIHDSFRGKLIDAEFDEIIMFLDNNPEIALINQSIEQKHYTDFETSGQ